MNPTDLIELTCLGQMAEEEDPELDNGRRAPGGVFAVLYRAESAAIQAGSCYRWGGR